ncbi:uncharacterized protein LOC128240955 [Mya arenaria]|uniref:uncharacterized protein LOC128240955 n=1 Tax=Mya arenaria TaxID=6604 RepID=UPI0022E3B0A8|nr:uncharacterized protein LOC128240955 [Mya arenaria]
MTFPFYEAEMFEDFPTLENAEPKIPHILHQTYKSELIPSNYIPTIKSFLQHHPNWTYYFWTEESARKMIEQKFAYFLPVWDGYKDPMNRADALRYFVLYEYGGVYTDCDVKFLRPLDRATKLFSAILPPEPFEHSVFRLKMPFLTNNAIIMSRPKHPFFKHLMDSLDSAKDEKWMLLVGGPLFVYNAFLKYNNINESVLNVFRDEPSVKGLVPYNLQNISKYPMGHEDHVLVPNTHFFLNTVAYRFDKNGVMALCRDILNNKAFRTARRSNVCRKSDFTKLCADEYSKTPELWKRGCNELNRRISRSKEEQFRFTFTEHLWSISYDKPKFDVTKTVNIKDVVPKAIVFN